LIYCHEQVLFEIVEQVNNLMRFASLAQQVGRRVASNGAARSGRATAARLACAFHGENNFLVGIWRRERAA
jgi:hypothetical protein